MSSIVHKSLAVPERNQENFLQKYIISPFTKNPITTVLFLGLLLFVIYQRLPLFLSEMEMTGKPAPDFILQDLEGKEIRLSDLRGKKVAINFWATWCAPCRVEIPVLNSIYGELNTESFQLLAVSSESKNEIIDFISLNPILYPVLVDNDYRVASDFNIMAYPTFVYIDEKGIITDIDSGVNFFLKWKLRYLATGNPF